MNKNYEKPDVEVIDFILLDNIMNADIGGSTEMSGIEDGVEDL